MNYYPQYHGWPAHGWPAYPHPHAQGFCHSCCHPMSMCVCGWRECRREAKELLVQSKQAAAEVGKRSMAARLYEMSRPVPADEPPSTGGNIGTPDPDRATLAEGATIVQPVTRLDVAEVKAGLDNAFIGGCCCVHLSIEYTSTNESSLVGVAVIDAENTILTWIKSKIQPGYYIKEGIMSTKPGATLYVLVVNAVARVRWCEVFRC